MVKLTEVEDEHFTTEKPTPAKNDTLLASEDEDDDFTDTGGWETFLPRLCLLHCLPKLAGWDRATSSFLGLTV